MSSRKLPIVLLLGAKSSKHPLAKIPEELSRLETLFSKHKYSKPKFELEHLPYFTQSQLKTKLDHLAGRIAVLHFAGHSDGKGLITDDEDDDKEVVYSHHIADHIRSWSQPPLLIFLNGCNNAEQVRAFHSANVAVVIATHRAIDDGKAAEFAGEFYDKLLIKPTQTSLQAAFEQASANVLLNTDGQFRSPSLESLVSNEPSKLDWGMYPQHDDHLNWMLNDLITRDRPIFNDEGELRNPYKGLEAFQEQDQAWFFGREALISELGEQVPENRFLMLLGASGSGKSSLINAGVIPYLRQDKDLLILQTRPGQSPFIELAKVIAQTLYPDMVGKRLDEQQIFATKLQDKQLPLSKLFDELLQHCNKNQVFLCIDQFEEIFTHSETNTVQVYLDQLVQLINSQSHVSLLLIMRADFLGSALSHTAFAQQLNHYSDKKLTVMSKAELRGAIENPANRQHIHLETALTEALLDDVENQAGSLPLLQYVLSLLWGKRKNGTITLDDYNAFGGLKKALETKADEIYQKFTDQQKAYCKKIFLRLITPGEGTEDTRRRANLSEFKDEVESTNIIKTLVSARLITTQQSNNDEQAFVEVSHEALIAHWAQLREWIAENRDQLRIQHQVARGANEWKGHKQDKAWLLTGTRLSLAEGWVNENTKQATTLEIDFIRAGVDERDSLVKRKEEQRVRNRNAVILFISLLSITLLFALMQWRESSNLLLKEQEARRQSQSLLHVKESNDFLKEGYLQKALSQAYKGYSINKSFETRSILFESLFQVSPYLVNSFSTNKPITSLSWSKGGEYISAGDIRGDLYVWDIADKSLVNVIKHPANQKNKLAMSLSQVWIDDVYIYHITKSGNLLVINSQTGKIEKNIKIAYSINDAVISKSADRVFMSGLNNNGKTLLASVRGPNYEPPLYYNDVFDNKIIVDFSFFSEKEKLFVATRNDGVVILDTRFNNAKLVSFQELEKVTAIDWNADSDIIVVGTNNGSVKSKDLSENGVDKSVLLSQQNDSITSILWHPEKLLISTTSSSGEVRILNSNKLNDNTLFSEKGKLLGKHEEAALTSSWSSKGEYLASGSQNGRVNIWQQEQVVSSVFNYFDAELGLHALSVSADGKLLATGGESGNLFIVSTDTFSLNKKITDPRMRKITALAWHPTESVIMAGDELGNIALLNYHGNNEIIKTAHGKAIWQMKWSENGDRLFTTSEDGFLKIWSFKDSLLQEISSKEHDDYVLGLEVDSKKKHIYSGSTDGKIRIWEERKADSIGEILLSGDLNSIGALAVNPKNKNLIAAAHNNGNVYISDIESGKEHVLESSQGYVEAVAFDMSGELLASGGSDGVLYLWDMKSMKPYATINLQSGHIWNVTWIPESKKLAVSTSEGLVFFLNVDDKSWVDRALSVTDNMP